MRSTRSRRQPDFRRSSTRRACWPRHAAIRRRRSLGAWHSATARGEGSAVGLYLWLTALRHNGHGRYGEALADARRACEHEDVMACGWALVELIEAGVRGGRPDEATAALDRLSERTRASGTEWALGVEARCRALLSDDESLYRESIERLARSRAAVELARSRLLYGEWLRRPAPAHGRAPRPCAPPTRASAAWEPKRSPSVPATSSSPPARRCAGSPGHARRPDAPGGPGRALGPRGAHQPGDRRPAVHRPRTVEYHLHKVFRKLDVSTRKELRDALADTSDQAIFGCV